MATIKPRQLPQVTLRRIVIDESPELILKKFHETASFPSPVWENVHAYTWHRPLIKPRDLADYERTLKLITADGGENSFLRQHSKSPFRIYWIENELGETVGFAKLRQYLSIEALSTGAGHISFGIFPKFKEMGYELPLLRELVEAAKKWCYAFQPDAEGQIIHVPVSRLYITVLDRNRRDRKAVEEFGAEYISDQIITSRATNQRVVLHCYWINLGTIA